LEHIQKKNDHINKRIQTILKKEININEIIITSLENTIKEHIDEENINLKRLIQYTSDISLDQNIELLNHIVGSITPTLHAHYTNLHPYYTNLHPHYTHTTLI